MVQSKGEFRVGVDFNPSGDPVVNEIKQKGAEFIDLVSSIPSAGQTPLQNEKGRLKALAQTSAEEAVMWAVKAATKQKPS